MDDTAFVEEAMKRIHSHRGVRGTVVVNGDGIPIRTTLDRDEANQYAALASQLTSRARRAVKNLAAGAASEVEDELQVVRVRSKKHEVIILPDFDKNREFMLIVIQDPSAHQPLFSEKLAG
ncbi:g3007 [Coccomyxa elongata]